MNGITSALVTLERKMLKLCWPQALALFGSINTGFIRLSISQTNCIVNCGGLHWQLQGNLLSQTGKEGLQNAAPSLRFKPERLPR